MRTCRRRSICSPGPSQLHMTIPSCLRAHKGVLIDGQPPGAAHGIDVDDRGVGTVTGPRLYQLIRQPAPIVDRRFEIEFLEPGAQVFSFTFG